ncbi:MAG: DUF192 domain-containing protein [Spirochaetia bacterium]|jgi:uncharacterized membrane protein (UPF0127 family)
MFSKLAPFVLVAWCLSSCQTAQERVTIRSAGQSLTVEVARTEAQREHGLMGRTNLGPRDGMIFVFERDDHLSFWMKNTPTPLSIAFLSAEGKVLQIEDMEPFSESIVRSRLSARYALEMRKGAFSDLGISEGDAFAFPERFP